MFESVVSFHLLSQLYNSLQHELSPNLYYLLHILRRPGLPNVPVVILHPFEVTVEQWGYIGMFKNVYLVRGSPVFDVDLLRAGVTSAGTVPLCLFLTNFNFVKLISFGTSRTGPCTKQFWKTSRSSRRSTGHAI